MLEEAFAQLNENQRLAVETIEGPMMVVAGAGTGKTQLLSLRVAQILAKTDTHPKQILCITFTESGARNLRTRLTKFIEMDAFQVTIGTFHQIGLDIIRKYTYYFDTILEYKPADQVIQHTIIDGIMQNLPTDNPLSSKLPHGGWAHMSSIISFISDMKKRGHTPQQCKTIFEENYQWCQEVSSHIIELYNLLKGKRGELDIQPIQTILEHVYQTHRCSEVSTCEHLCEIVLRDLQEIQNRWFGQQCDPRELRAYIGSLLDRKPDHIDMKQVVSHQKHLALIDIYAAYTQQLHKQGYLDFDDLLLEVIKKAEIDPGFRAELYEEFLYIMVDEYQDTSGVQMQFLNVFIDTEMWNNQPNIMVVGDDDQAIFGFQGATLANIRSFSQTYPTLTVIPLVHNYRSRQAILDFSSEVISQADERLIHIFEHLNKNLISRYE
jgi:DNA helicase II / ATP-dependent DNA helicase PcrA